MENFLFDKAKIYFRKALTAKKTELNAQIQFQIGEALQAKGDLENAVIEYLKVVYLYPDYKFWVLRAELKAAESLEKLDRLEEAVKLYEKLSAEDAEEADFAKKKIKELRLLASN
jgi:tetratricopeptide (TPR) repeat protein